MRGMLLGGIAAAVCCPQIAAAQEWTAAVGGEFISGVGYVDAEAAEAAGEVVADYEVHIVFRLTADNGLTFGAKAELEANGADGNMDEYVASVRGAFGTIEIGAEDGAGDRLLLTPPGCNLSCSGDGDGFLFDYADDVAGDAIDNDGGDSSDDLKLTYFTPTLGGLTDGDGVRAGVSWGPTGEEGPTSTSGLRDDPFVEVGARYDFDLSAAMGDPEAELALAGAFFAVNDYEDQSAAFAAELDAFGFGVGGRYAFLETDDEHNLSLGVQYGTGPWDFGLNGAVVLESEGRGDGDYGISGEVNYALAPGVTLAAVVEYADYDVSVVTVEARGPTFGTDPATGAPVVADPGAPEQSVVVGDSFAVGLLMEFDF